MAPIANMETLRTVVLHVTSSPADVERAVATAARLRSALAGTDVRIIVNGPALYGLTAGGELADVEACGGGLDQLGIDPSTLRAGVVVIPSAAVALAEAQFAGAAYIRI